MLLLTPSTSSSSLSSSLLSLTRFSGTSSGVIDPVDASMFIMGGQIRGMGATLLFDNAGGFGAEVEVDAETASAICILERATLVASLMIESRSLRSAFVGL